MTAAAPAGARPIVNVMTVDVEDYFQVSAFAGAVTPEDWPRHESRVVANTERVLQLLADAGVRGTFFILGWTAERHPGLVRQIAAAGHDLASHSYWHRLVYDLTPAQLRDDLRRARAVIEDAAGVRVVGFRAPSFSIVERSLWALDLLIEEGYRYDASIFPIRHDRYGIPDAPRRTHVVDRSQGSIVEVPATACRYGGLTLPVGGGYFRLLPYAVTRRAIATLNARDGQPAVFYTHPWEFDPGQPRIRASLLSRFRHYNNLQRTAARFAALLRDFRFDSIERVLLDPAGAGRAA